jgi:nucleoside-diphosphate-sugar epimerase
MAVRVLILGASGFIGWHVSATLARTDWAFPVLASRRRPPSPAPARSESVILDATDEAALSKAATGAEAVVNCIAGDPKSMVASARALIAVAAQANNPPRIVHFSSMAVYGSAPGDVDESIPMVPDSGAYAAAKIRIEELCADQPNVLLLRPGIVYGPRSSQWSERIALWLLSHRIGDLGAAGDGYCNLVYIDDVVAAVAAALWAPQGGTYNLAAPNPPTWNEYFVAYAKALGAVPARRISRRHLLLESKLLAPPLKIAELAVRAARLRGLALPPPMPPSLLALFRQRIRLNSTKATEQLGLRWTPLDEGLQRAASWFQSRTAAQASTAGVGADLADRVMQPPPASLARFAQRGPRGSSPPRW